MKAIGKQARLPAIRLVRSTRAFVAIGAIVSTWTTAGAQTALLAATEGRNAPGGAGGTPVISVRQGTKVAVVITKGSNVLVTVEGWVDASRLVGRLDTFPASVDAKAPLRVRAAASAGAAILAELRPRTGVHTLGKSGTWTRIRRGVWIPASALSKMAPPVATPRPPVSPAASPKPPVSPAKSPDRAPDKAPAASPEAPAVPAGAMSVSKTVKLLAAPGGRAVGELASGAVVQPLMHDHGFAKVRIEGWVPERELSPADSSLGSQLTAADLRADPDGARGRTVQWEVEILSLQTADPLRRELARDEPYLLAKGPGAENALLYLAVPPSLLNEAKALPPLTHVLIVARVRAGHSEPLGTPILDLKSISKR